MMKLLIEEKTINGKLYRFETHITNKFDMSAQNKIVNGFALNDKNEVLLIRGENKPWSPPGGSIEKDETPEQALIREMYEEAAVHIDPKTIEPLFYQKTFIDIEGSGELVYVGNKLRYACKIATIDTFIVDPDNADITEQKFCSIDDLPKYVNWGTTIELTEQLLKKLIQTEL